jgi:hypothetical protein
MVKTSRKSSRFWVLKFRKLSLELRKYNRQKCFKLKKIAKISNKKICINWKTKKLIAQNLGLIIKGLLSV